MKDYKKGRAIAQIVEFWGWLLVGVGILYMAVAFLLGDPLNIVSGSRIRFTLRLLAMLPGLCVVFSGLIAVLLAHTAQAAFSGAEGSWNTYKLLETQMRAGNRPSHPATSSPSMSSQNAAAPATAQSTEHEAPPNVVHQSALNPDLDFPYTVRHGGKLIRHNNQEAMVDGRIYPSLDEAIRSVDRASGR